GGERHADLGPVSARDELAAPGGAHRGDELGVFPRVRGRPVDGGSSASSSASSGTVGFPRPVSTLIVEWMIGSPKAFAVFTVETMFSSSSSRSIDVTAAICDG